MAAFKPLPTGKKYWVFIPRHHSHLFEKLCHEILKEMNYACPNYLAHRFIMLHPQICLDAGIDVFHGVQSEGQAVFVFPRVYHCGKLHLLSLHRLKPLQLRRKSYNSCIFDGKVNLAAFYKLQIMHFRTIRFKKAWLKRLYFRKGYNRCISDVKVTTVVFPT